MQSRYRRTARHCGLYEQRFFERLAVLHPEPDQRRAFHVQHDQVCLHSCRDASDLVFQIQCLGRAARREIERQGCGQTPSNQLRHLVRRAHRLEHRECRPRADVSRQTHAYRPIGLLRAPQIK